VKILKKIATTTWDIIVITVKLVFAFLLISVVLLALFELI
jgi:hypothetical protein